MKIENLQQYSYSWNNFVIAVHTHKFVRQNANIPVTFSVWVYSILTHTTLIVFQAGGHCGSALIDWSSKFTIEIDESMLDRNFERLKDNLILIFRYWSPTHISDINLISVSSHSSASAPCLTSKWRCYGVKIKPPRRAPFLPRTFYFCSKKRKTANCCFLPPSREWLLPPEPELSSEPESENITTPGLCGMEDSSSSSHPRQPRQAPGLISQVVPLVIWPRV